MIAAWFETLAINPVWAIVLAPLFGATLTLLAPGVRSAWTVASVCALAWAAVTLDVCLSALLAGGLVAGAFALEGAGAFLAPAVALCTALTIVSAARSAQDMIAKAGPFAFSLMLTAGGAWCAALLARDLVGVALSVEIAALASAGVAALTAERDRAGLNGALRLFSASAAAGAIVLFSLAALLQSIGVLDLAALPFALIEAPVLASLGAGLFIIGVAARAGVAPMHAWLAAAAGRGGAASAMLLAVVGAFGGLSVIVRVSSYFIQAPALGEAVGAVLAGLGVAGVAAGSLQAIGATSLRRLGVYAGVAQGGCVLLAAALGSAAGHAAALVMLASFAGAALALFAGAAAMRGPGPFAMDALDGFGRRAPLAGAALAAAALSFMGAPLTLGFLGRWRLMEASVGAEWGWAAAAGIAASLAGVFFGGRLIERLYFRKFAAPAQSEEAWAFALTPALLVGAAAVISGVAPAWLLRLASLAAANLGAGP